MGFSVSNVDFLPVIPSNLRTHYAALLSNSSGKVTRVWLPLDDNSPEIELLAQSFTTTGAILTQPAIIQHSEKSYFHPETIQNFVDKAGGVRILWLDTSPSGDTFVGYLVQAINDDGTLAGGPKNLSDLMAVKIPDLALLFGVHIWNNNNDLLFATLNTSTSQRVVQVFDSDFNEINIRLDLSSFGSTWEIYGADRLANGNFVVAIDTSQNARHSTSFAIFGANGDLQHNITPSIGFDRLADSTVKFATFEDGGFATFFFPNAVANVERQVAIFYDKDGTQVSAELGFESGVRGEFETCVRLPENRIAVVWDNNSITRVKIFDSHGNSLSDASFVFPDRAIEKVRMAARVTTSGNFLIVEKSSANNKLHSVKIDLTKYDFTSGDDHWVGKTDEGTLHGRAGNDILGGSAANNFIFGDAGNDTLIASAGRDVLNGGNGNDTADFSAQTAALTFSLDSSIAAHGAVLNDTLISIENLIGSAAGNDTLVGDSGANRIAGLGGDDVLRGRAGNDSLSGGSGADVIDGGRGFDIADYSERPGEIVFDYKGVTVSLVDSSLNGGHAAGDVLVGIEGLIGTEYGQDRLTGDDQDNRIFGKGGGDRINGGGGDDFLAGGTGRNFLNGELGKDTISYAWITGHIVVNMRGGNGTVLGYEKGSSFLVAEDNIQSIEQIVGSIGDDQFQGGSTTNFFDGGAGKDALSGEAGNDELEGGSGADLVNGGAGNDTAAYMHSQGVHVSLDGSLARTGDAKGDRLISIENLTGSMKRSDMLAGDAGKNILSGLGGNDQLFGRDGNDVLSGGAGKDVLNGGNGLDIANYSDGKAVHAALDNSIQATGDARGDTFINIEGLRGSDTGDDELVGNASDNWLVGGGGADRIHGQDGNDMIYGGSGADYLRGGEGTDFFVFKLAEEGGDRIEDFGGADRIVMSISKLVEFAEVPDLSVIPKEFFQSGASNTANTNRQFVIFREGDSTLWWDQDGSDSLNQPILLARFTNGHQLTADEILIG